MIRLALSACTLAAIAMAGCNTPSTPPPPVAAVTATGGTPVTTMSPGTYRAGTGIVESISLVTPPASASAGGTVPPASSAPYRATLRMEDGSVQSLLVDTRAFLVGDRLQIMPDGRLVRL
jgi:hypothetical protein